MIHIRPQKEIRSKKFDQFRRATAGEDRLGAASPPAIVCPTSSRQFVGAHSLKQLLGAPLGAMLRNCSARNLAALRFGEGEGQ